ncbi:hypothetical protein Y032_0011g1383 [Ancylostoma ceylanicum]|uniref:Uncharacterized protein n=1 Tax=Ancylostoma ceylanicum TaxID=53326 RepID=A0A016VDP5_9BILA|nr:hypothetical protein Y032_0011g1383 [Ancylostoma ceylanicum]
MKLDPHEFFRIFTLSRQTTIRHKSAHCHRYRPFGHVRVPPRKSCVIKRLLSLAQTVIRFLHRLYSTKETGRSNL